MNKYEFILKDKENPKAKEMTLIRESLTLAYARKMMEIEYPDYHIKKITFISQDKKEAGNIR